MNHLRLLTLLPALWGFASLQATSVTTDPVGAMRIEIKGNGALNFIGIPFLEAADYTGPVTAVGSSTLSVSSVDFDELLDSGRAYFVEIANGDNAGVNTSIVSWSGSTLTLADNFSGLLSPNDERIAIHTLLTISEVFGVGGDVLQGGNPNTADLIYFPNPTGQGLVIVYYSNGGPLGTGWRQVGTGNTDRSNLPIYFSEGLYIYKKSAGASELLVSGAVKMTPTSVLVESGFFPYSVVYPAGTTLASSGLYDPQDTSNSISAGNPNNADIIYVDSTGDGLLEAYFYSTSPVLGFGWRQIGGGNVDKSHVPISSGFGLNRRTPGAVSVNRPVGFLVEQ